MVVSGSTERGGKVPARSVDGLPLVFEVDAAGDFGDQDWGEVFGAVVFVHTEVVNFSHLDLVIFHTCQDRHTSNTRYQLLILIPDTHKPLGLVPRG